MRVNKEDAIEIITIPKGLGQKNTLEGLVQAILVLEIQIPLPCGA